MRFEQRNPASLRPWAFLALVLCLFTSGRNVSASGQDPAPELPPQQAGQPAQAQGTARISADEAVKMALENNLGLQTERLNPRLQALAVSRALAVYTPVLFANTSRTANTTPPTEFLQSGVAVTTAESFSTNGGVQHQLPWGGNYEVSLSGSRSTSDAPRTVFSPQLGSQFNAIYNQPLLRNFSIDGFRQTVLQSRNEQDIADIRLAERITLTSRTVRNAYFNLINAISSLQVAQQSLDLARTSLKNNQRRVEVGTMAPIDIVDAEAEVARQEETVIVRQADIQSAEDALRTLIMNPSQPDFWTTRLEPSEQPVLTPQAVDVEAAVRNALANRTDLAQLRKEIDSADINIRFNRNQKLPNVNLQARYGLQGVGGSQFDYGAAPIEGGPPPRELVGQRSFSDVLRDVFGNEFRNWSVSLQVSYPIGTSQADAALAQSRLARQQGQVSLRELETEVARQVRDAGRQVETTLKRVDATLKARQFAERRLEAEDKRLAVGLSDTFRVFQVQRDLANAKQAELNAIIAYNRALIDMDAVQSVPVSGGGGR
jgi:outer membrane protein